MAVSVSVAVLLAIILVMMIRSKAVKAGPAIVAALFGFFLASTDIAPSVNRFMDSLANTISQIHF